MVAVDHWSLVTLAWRPLWKVETATSRASTMTSSRALIPRDPEAAARWETRWRWPTATGCAESGKQAPVAGGEAVPACRRCRRRSDPGDAGTSTRAPRWKRRRRRLAGVRRCSNRTVPERAAGRRHESAELGLVRTGRRWRLERRWLGKRRRRDHTANSVLGAGVCPSFVDFETISVHHRHQWISTTDHWRYRINLTYGKCASFSHSRRGRAPPPIGGTGVKRPYHVNVNRGFI